MRPEATVPQKLRIEGELIVRGSARVPDGWTVDKAAIHAGWKSLLAEASRLPKEETILVVTSNGIARFLPDVVDAVPVGLQPKLKTGAWGIVACNAGTRILAWNERPPV